MSKRASLKTIVGQRTYTVWIEILQTLVPEGRTHRIAPMVAGVLQYAAAVAYDRYGDEPEEDTVAYWLFSKEVHDPQAAPELLGLVKQLFDDAGVKCERVDHRGDGYSIAENAIYEFIHWYDMPWES